MREVMYLRLVGNLTFGQIEKSWAQRELGKGYAIPRKERVVKEAGKTMNHRIPCEIIQDLMPMYADGLTSGNNEPGNPVHLEECGTCREMYERMKADMEGSIPNSREAIGN